MRQLKADAPLDAPIRRLYPAEAEPIVKDYVCQRLDVAMPLFTLGFKDTDTALRGDALLKKEIEMKILLELLFSKCSDIYKTLYEKGLINDSFDADYECHEEYAFCVPDGRVKRPAALYATLCGICSGGRKLRRRRTNGRKRLFGATMSVCLTRRSRLDTALFCTV